MISARRDKSFLNYAFILIIALTGLRAATVGPDTIQYIRHFERVCDGTYYRLDDQFELGYKTLTKAVSYLTDQPQILLIIAAIIVNVPILKFIQRFSRDKLLSVILYITVGSFTFQLTGIRQSIAMSLCIVAIDYVLRRKFIMFSIFIVLAAFFHRSAILFLPVYFLSNHDTNRRRFFIIAVSVATVLFSSSLFIQLGYILGYEEYLGTAGVSNGGGWTYIAMMSIALLLHILVPRNRGEVCDGEHDQFFFTLLLFALVLYIIRYEVRVAERVSNYYRIALIILLPNTISRFEDCRIRNMLRLGCLVLSIALFFYWLDMSRYIYSFFWESIG